MTIAITNYVQPWRMKVRKNVLDSSMSKTKCVETVLAFFESAVKEYEMNRDIMKYTDDKTQDILHELELVPHRYNEKAKLAQELAEVRKQRRTSKNTCEILAPIVGWYLHREPDRKKVRNTYKDFEELLKSNKTTIYRVSNDTGIPKMCLYDWKSGKSTPKVDKLKKIAEYFNVPLEQLI